MRSRRYLIGLALLLMLGGLMAMPAVADQPLELIVYSSPTCDSCEIVKAQVLEPLGRSYGDKLTMTFVDVSNSEGLAQLEAVEARLGKRNNPLPVILLDDQLYASVDIFELEKSLAATLEDRLGAPESLGGTPVAAIPTVPAAVSEPAASASQGAAIHLAYVDTDGCANCARAHILLQVIQEEYPTLVVTTFNNVRDAELVEAMGQHLGLAQERRLVAPSIYAGGHALVDEEITSDGLRALLQRYASSGVDPFWERLDVAAGKSSILTRFRAMGPLAVIVAGLVDGINPCAFATIIFFVSYLAISRRRRTELLVVGLAFTAGVFATYLLVGLGAMSLLKLASTVRSVGLVLYSLMAASCLVLAGLSLHDYVMARQGRLKEMRLNLPEPLRERIKGRIRGASGAFIGAALVSGLVVSLLELACTGQVYLPTISFVVGIPDMRAYAVAYLLLYNLLFVAPLLVVLLLAVYGVSASRFQDWFVRNAARTKAAMAILFLLLAALLLSQVLSM